MKRFFDIYVSLITLLIATPFMILIALLIKLESKGPIIFRQERVGRFEALFSIYKFRSMVIDADSHGPYYTENNDVRITRVGCFIRKTSLDELPQLFNVIKGDMSLVGPRPDLLRQRSGYSKKQWHKRHTLRPGITGLAQATLRSQAAPGERVRLDLEYIDKSSFKYDLWIIALTVKQVLLTGGN